MVLNAGLRQHSVKLRKLWTAYLDYRKFCSGPEERVGDPLGSGNIHYSSPSRQPTTNKQIDQISIVKYLCVFETTLRVFHQ